MKLQLALDFSDMNENLRVLEETADSGRYYRIWTGNSDSKRICRIKSIAGKDIRKKRFYVIRRLWMEVIYSQNSRLNAVRIS